MGVARAWCWQRLTRPALVTGLRSVVPIWKWLLASAWPSTPPASRLVFPGYKGTRPDGPGRSRGLQFRTYVGPGKDDPELEVLKLDYNLESNPGYIVRDVLDELVQVDTGYYLGKAHLFWRNHWRCAAYFTLQQT